MAHPSSPTVAAMFQTLDATGRLDSDYVFTAEPLASFLGESMPLDDAEMRA